MPSIPEESFLEVVGIPDSIQSIESEVKALTIFRKIGCKVSPCDIEACHCTKKGQWQGNCQVLTL